MRRNGSRLPPKSDLDSRIPRTKKRCRNSSLKTAAIAAFAVGSAFPKLLSSQPLALSFVFSNDFCPFKSSSLLEASSTSYLLELDTVDQLQEGSLVMSRVESSLGCHDLRQPYFHKAVVLILDHDPDDFTQGVLLNRASDLTLDDRDIVYMETDENEDTADQFGDLEDFAGPSSSVWRIHFGGDIGGWYEEAPQLICIHGISSEAALAVSDPIFGIEDGVFLTSHLGARSLIESGEATSDDFYTFSGFCGWEEGQLQREVDRGSWCLASFATNQEERGQKKNLSKTRNNHILMDLIEQYCWKNDEYNPQSGGLGFWHELMANLEKDDVKPLTQKETKRDTRDQSFSDLMVKEWSTQRLLVSKDAGNKEYDDTHDGEPHPTSQIDDAYIFRALKAATGPTSVPPGTILRGSSASSSPYIISGQLFHKSTILFLQDNPEASVGVVLNLPTKEAYILKVDDREYAFPIRYGGPSGKRGEEGPYFWFHDNNFLKSKGIGIPVSFSNAHPERTDSDGVHVCELEDVHEALENDFASEDDFLMVQGFCAWEKEGGSAGGVTGQLLNGNLEDTKLVTTNQRRKLWNALREQKLLLSDDCLEKNYELSQQAWQSSEDGSEEISSEGIRQVYESDVDVSKLADDALWVWMNIFLLGNGEYYPEDL